MKVVGKRVFIENEKFVLIRDDSPDGVYYGTIPYNELDNRGNLKRSLNGYDMAIVFLDECKKCNKNPILAAIEERKRRIPLDKFLAEVHSQEEIIQFILSM